MKPFFLKTMSAGKCSFKDSLALLLLRLCFGGAMLVQHGLAKWGKNPESLPNPYDWNPTFNGWLILFAEIVCAFLLVIGLASRWCALILGITMAVACFEFHAGDDFADRELSFLYLGAFASLMIFGGGILSVDRLIEK